MKTAEEIKPCPFCNSAAELRGGNSATYGRFWYSVGCEKCDVWIHDKEVWDGGKLDKNHPPMECVTVWNTRAIQSDAIESTVRKCAEVAVSTCGACSGKGYFVETGYGHNCDGTESSCAVNCPVPVQQQRECEFCQTTSQKILSLIPQKEKKV